MEEKLTPQEQERRFQEALAIGNIEEIWLRVIEACKANAKKLLKVHITDEVFHDRLMEAVVTVMAHINDGVKPQKLITYCYFPVLKAFFGEKAKREDKEWSYEQSIENGYESAVNEIGEIIE